MKVKVGDKLPDAKVFLLEKDPKEVSIKEIINSEKTILFGLPGAFTPTCYEKHLPSFINASDPKKGKALYSDFVQMFKRKGLNVKTGEFGAHMNVNLINNGPVTFVIDSNDI